MEQIFDNLVYVAQQSQEYSFSLKGDLPLCGDTIDLPMLEHPAGRFFSLFGCLNWSALEVVKDKLLNLSLSVSDVVFHSAKRVLRRAVAGVRHFVCSNQRGKRRVVPMVPMALRL